MLMNGYLAEKADYFCLALINGIIVIDPAERPTTSAF